MSRTRPNAGVREGLLAAWRISGHRGARANAPPSPQQIEALAGDLYSRWFCSIEELHAAAAPAPAQSPADPPPGLVPRLRAAHAITGRFETGWIVGAVAPGGMVTTGRGAEQLFLLPPDYVNLTRPAVPVRVGDPISVTLRRDAVDPDNAWWVTYGQAGDPTTGGEMARVYWNCPPESIEDLIAGLTAALEHSGLPYSLKCPVQSELFLRRDPVVVYLSLDGWRKVKPSLRELHSGLADRLREPVPPLTLRLGRGVAAAEDPGGQQSFGQSRTLAIAEGILSADRKTVADPDRLVGRILEYLKAHDISPTRPYLKASSPARQVTSW